MITYKMVRFTAHIKYSKLFLKEGSRKFRRGKIHRKGYNNIRRFAFGFGDENLTHYFNLTF